MAPLARERGHVASAIENMSAVAEATAERRGALEANIAQLPSSCASCGRRWRGSARSPTR